MQIKKLKKISCNLISMYHADDIIKVTGRGCGGVTAPTILVNINCFITCKNKYNTKCWVTRDF